MEQALGKINAPNALPPFIEAALKGQLRQVGEFLADSSLDVNQRDSETMTALHWAAAYNEPRIVELLVADARCDVNISNKRGNTPLHQAAQCSAHDSARVLLACSRANVNAVNEWHESALMMACQSGDKLMASVLLNAGADRDIRDKWGNTAAQVAHEHGESSVASVFKLTQEQLHQLASSAHKPESVQASQTVQATRRGIPCDLVSQLSFPVLSRLMEAPLNEDSFYAWLNEPLIDLNGADYYKLTALHKVASWNKEQCLDALLQRPELDFAARGPNGNLAIHLALEMAAFACASRLAADERFLQGALLNARNDDGFTALHYSIMHGHVELALHLLNHPAIEVHHATRDGHTVYHIATLCKCEAVEEVIRQRFPHHVCELPTPPAKKAAAKRAPAKLNQAKFAPIVQIISSPAHALPPPPPPNTHDE
jgi:ankyrin repeat protein